MNDFEAWEKIISEWKEVNRMKKLNQELYDMLAGTITYIGEYSKKNNIALPNKNEINRMIGRIHILMNKIDTPYQTPNLNTDKNNESDPDNLPVLTIKTLIICEWKILLNAKHRSTEQTTKQARTS